jgi:hypothetical protein
MINRVKQIDNLYLRVAKIVTFSAGQALTNATGFFYLHHDFLYLITARHVVSNGMAMPRPDRLQLALHTDSMDPQKQATLSIPLYRHGVEQWYQHSVLGAGVDLVAVPINDPDVLSNHLLATFTSNDILDTDEDVPLGQDVLILGYPLGFHDSVNNLPIVRRAIIASSFSHPFKGNSYFLTDARLHRGMSGSPVVYCPSITEHRDEKWRLLGVHTSALDVSDRDPDQDERLALNTSWYASLIPELVPVNSQRTAGG